MRGLSDEFLGDLDTGSLSPLLKRVQADPTLCLEIRDESLNVYYRGGNLLRVKPCGDGGYEAWFDPKYAGEFKDAAPFNDPLPKAADAAGALAWTRMLPAFKEAMDLYTGVHAMEERELQQQIVRANNFGGQSNKTDYYICDIEYVHGHSRFDVVGVRWPSSGADRKRRRGHRLVLGEVKHGMQAVKGKASLSRHVADVDAFLAAPANLESLKREMTTVFNQKRSLRLIPDCKNPLDGFSDEPPILLLILANHDPDSRQLHDELKALPEIEHAEVRVATACFFGCGLYDPTIYSLETFRSRFADAIVDPDGQARSRMK